jgi:hypothetical protein
MADLTRQKVADMLAKLDDVCRPSFYMSERTKRMIAAHRGTGGRSRIRRRRSKEISLLRPWLLCAGSSQRGLIHYRAFLAASRRLFRRGRRVERSIHARLSQPLNQWLSAAVRKSPGFFRHFIGTVSRRMSIELRSHDPQQASRLLFPDHARDELQLRTRSPNRSPFEVDKSPVHSRSDGVP